MKESVFFGSPSDLAFFSKQSEVVQRAMAHPDRTQPKLLALPHPKRIGLFGMIAAEWAILERIAPEVAKEVLSPDSNRYDIAHRLATGPAREFFGDNREALMEIALRAMVHKNRVRLLQTTDALEERLRLSDFGDEVPGSWFRPPFPACFIEFGTKRDFPWTLLDPVSGEHRIEGAYLIEGKSLEGPGGEPLDRPVPAFDLIITASPVGKTSHLDDAFIHSTLIISDEAEPVTHLMERTVSRFRAMNQGVASDDRFVAVIAHLAKILIYLGTRDARTSDVREGSLAQSRLAGIKSPGKRAKAERQSQVLYDRVVVGPERFYDTKNYEAGTSVRTHWRRGHFRMQRHGAGLSLSHPVWIQPLLVNADQLNGEVAVGEYVVK